MIEVLDHAADAVLLPVLEARPEWTAYALCDLDPPYRDHSHFVAAVEEGQPIAVALIYDLQGVPALLPFGSARGVGAILQGAHDPPSAIFFLAESLHLEAIESRFVIEAHWPMSRMCVHARELRGPTSAALPVRRLTVDDAPYVRALYDHWEDAPFETEMLEYGVYAGVWDADTLVAIAGTHAVSRHRRLAAIGGVFTHSDYRGRGFATATTGEVCRLLAHLNIHLIVLNVRADNAFAVRAYERLGFAHRVPYREGHATVR